MKETAPIYEMLTGRNPFGAATVSDIIVPILGREPDWSLLPPATPARVRWLLRRCLEKDPRRRLHDIADARIELEEALSNPSESGAAAPAILAPSPARTHWRELVAWITAAAALATLLAIAKPGEPWTIEEDRRRWWAADHADGHLLLRHWCVEPGQRHPVHGR